MKRSIVATILLLSALAGLATGVFLPALAHNTSKKPPLHCIAIDSKSCQPIKPVKKPPLHCGVIIASPSRRKQPCVTLAPRYQHYLFIAEPSVSAIKRGEK